MAIFSSMKLPRLYLLCFCINFASATSNISVTNFLNDPETLVSSNSIYKLGFFSPINSTNRYVGIWYIVDPLEVVWVANRDRPLNHSSGVFKLSDDGNLQLSDEQNRIYWSTNVSLIGTNNTVAQLLDTGNLVLISSTNGSVLWQSVDHLTDTLVSQVTIKFRKNMESRPMLRSWKSASNPSSGRFTIRLIQGGLPEFVTEFDDKPYWRPGPWNGFRFIGIPDMYAGAGYGFRFMNNEDEGTLDFFFSWENQTAPHYHLSYDGNLFHKYWDDANHKWLVQWQSMRSDCEFYGKCGPFGSCNPKNSPICKCLKGFEPKNFNEWSNGNWSGGCVRRTPLQSCNVTGVQEDGFVRLNRVKIPDFANYIFAIDEDDCRSKCLGNCSCLAYALPQGIGCVVWNRSLIDIQEFSTDAAVLYVRLAHSELGESNKLKIIIITAATIIAAVILGVIFYYLWKWKGKVSSRKETNFVDKSPLNQDDFKDLNLLTLQELEKATNNFSETNKLGRGGFGPVYKGKLEDGQEIAVKRLSRASGQGLQEFMNEVVVISKLQHRNLVRLYGCCVEGEEKLLVYEYMPNKSLDALLFDSNYREQLDWKTRFNIINGICRGLLYLHRDSRLKIIHRDLKASNILLDEELNPKISDFGMARIFETKQDEANTLRVVGTYGYMSPEYAMEGRFSEKSDVFSLGVLLLEIVSGRKNTRFLPDESLSLLTYTWKLWNENDILSLIDSTIFEPCFKDEIMKCIQIGLLCVQEFPEDRPNISELLSMLDVNDNADLPLPTQPGFTHRKTNFADDVFQSSQEYGSINNVSLTAISGR